MEKRTHSNKKIGISSMHPQRTLVEAAHQVAINEISMKKDPFDTHVNNAVTEIKTTLSADGHEAGKRLEAKHMAAINNITQSHYDKYSTSVGHDNHQKKFDNAVFDGTDLFT